MPPKTVPTLSVRGTLVVDEGTFNLFYAFITLVSRDTDGWWYINILSDDKFQFKVHMATQIISLLLPTSA